MTNKFKVGILVKEVIPVGFKRTQSINFSLDGNSSNDYVDSVYSENKYSLLTLNEYLDKGGVKGIFKELLSNFIQKMGNIDEFTKEYMTDISLISYSDVIEKELINEININGYDEYKNSNYKELIEFDNIRYYKGNLQDTYFIDKDNDEKEDNIFNQKVYLLSQIKS